ncbi:GTA-gp10 family protein [Ketogulonicigenium vulgare]|uniref:Gene transfer agent protein n=1 Tax=Ketogulonicigenium vulgare (strain WSH-001) TaxID=759362 RepID=F9Y9R9_KETVW|nr:GTA-gp10 family protein [Ketogulonicigenium vulgare]ADO43116.1 hypothetical protein EIO_2007 [Ketogulonicigenium vulgare Y25]AEM41407.1 hypothetical protein KVU_1568 [Ketogulonicigenium vulgare WSH-001]ALJ81541.1 hypothetical protein KVH_10355 [Ketogulonicigenium vulgare]ANW34239.1 hypothetical protein KvSKV_10295 [Ketogulonicigenium vulgare]AOZ55151.1 hypothetical protein KVC_2144 [Ketogulonicigenium vulgare]
MAEAQVINWTCGEHAFRLRIGEAEALDDLTPQGIADFRFRCRQGIERGSLGFSPVRVREVIDCIRLGLIGGGMEGDAARALALRAMEEADFAELVKICYGIVTGFFSGKDHDQPEKPVAAEMTDENG